MFDLKPLTYATRLVLRIVKRRSQIDQAHYSIANLICQQKTLQGVMRFEGLNNTPRFSLVVGYNFIFGDEFFHVGSVRIKQIFNMIVINCSHNDVSNFSVNLVKDT